MSGHRNSIRFEGKTKGGAKQSKIKYFLYICFDQKPNALWALPFVVSGHRCSQCKADHILDSQVSLGLLWRWQIVYHISFLSMCNKWRPDRWRPGTQYGPTSQRTPKHTQKIVWTCISLYVTFVCMHMCVCVCCVCVCVVCVCVCVVCCTQGRFITQRRPWIITHTLRDQETKSKSKTLTKSKSSSVSVSNSGSDRSRAKRKST